VSCGGTTISCRVFALIAVLLACAAGSLAAADKLIPPRLPVTQQWSVDLGGAASAAPAAGDDRVYVALKSAHFTARDIADGHELWRIPKEVVTAPVADGGLVFVAAGEAIEALRGSDGGNAWTVPRVKTAAPLLAAAGWVFAVTDAELLAIRARDGQVVWRHAAGGVRLAPAVDGDRVYLGANDGRILALTLASGDVVWENYVPGGVTAIAAHRGLVYAGAGDKQFYCLDARKGAAKWSARVGSIVTGRISVDEEHVYFGALDNVVRALDRSNGNQRWKEPLNRRPIAGVYAAGHIVFVPASAPELIMLYDATGQASGNIALPGEMTADLPPDVRETPAGLHIFVVTGGLANVWQLTFIGPASELPLTTFAAMVTMPGLDYLTDPELQPIGRVLGTLILDDPPLQPLSASGWPVVLTDPPLQPLTTLPGLQLRPLSPALPVRRGG
jgi:outer membrane protein assembly factor BamB